MLDPVAGYDAHGASLAARYEQLRSEDVHAAIVDLLPSGVGRSALDVGAGSGRDSAWLASLGFDVVAVEPAQGMRDAGQTLHPHSNIRWINDQLPMLDATHRLGLAFDVVLLSGVLMHVRPEDRSTALQKIATLLKPGGRLLVSVRNGAGTPERPMWPLATDELESCALAHGLAVLRVRDGHDLLDRVDVRWTTYALQLPDGRAAVRHPSG